MDSRLSLPVNTILDGSYRIVRVVGSGGFGITYEAEDVNLGTAVAIKEYYPFDFGVRDATMSVKPKSDHHKKTFDWGRSNFLQEARTLARFEHPSVVRVARVFEANSTAYMVMRFEHGHSFEAWLDSLDRLPTQDELDSVVAPLLDALQMMHAESFLHRDIAPDNIIVRTDGTPVLLDFGAARRAVAEMSRTLTGIVKAGYSPHEQYSSDSRLQGPWSDLYALGGTLYRAVTGKPPAEATLRVDEDHMAPASQVARKNGYRPGFLSAIDACLKVRHSERPRSVAQLRPMVLDKSRLAEVFKTLARKVPLRPPSRPGQPSPTPRTGQPSGQSDSRWWWPAVAAAILTILGGAYGGYEYSRRQPAVEAQRQAAEAKKKADEEAELAAKVTAQRQAEADISKSQDPERVVLTELNAEERATFVKRIQEVLKQSKCYEGAINGSSEDAQQSLDRYIKSAHQHGKDKPANIKLAKATASDFDSWLKQADAIKDGLCATAPEKEHTVSKPSRREEPRRAQPTERGRARAAESEPRPSDTPRLSYGGASFGGGGGPIQGVR